MKKQPATILREYGPFPGATSVAGVTYDGRNVWFASGDKINALDPASGEITRDIKVPAEAGTAFDGTHLYQIADSVIRKIDPASGKVLATIPAPGNGDESGMAWAEGTLWVGEHRARKIHQIDPETGKVLRSIESDRFVTGVTWIAGDHGDGELWHATWENDASELRRVDAASGEVLESLEMPAGANVSGLEADGKDRFYCGGGNDGKVRAVKRVK
jgi:glutamine cyclotransferase